MTAVYAEVEETVRQVVTLVCNSCGAVRTRCAGVEAGPHFPGGWDGFVGRGADGSTFPDDLETWRLDLCEACWGGFVAALPTQPAVTSLDDLPSVTLRALREQNPDVFGPCSAEPHGGRAVYLRAQAHTWVSRATFDALLASYARLREGLDALVDDPAWQAEQAARTGPEVVDEVIAWLVAARDATAAVRIESVIVAPDPATTTL